jgi:hypothetical protein
MLEREVGVASVPTVERAVVGVHARVRLDVLAQDFAVVPQNGARRKWKLRALHAALDVQHILNLW